MTQYQFPIEYGHRSSEFIVTYDEKPMEVLECTVSAFPFNQCWPGYQRPLDQTEKSAFVLFGCEDAFTLDITSDRDFSQCVVRPLSRNITSERTGERTVRITFPGVGQYSVEFDGTHHVLTVFANPEKEFDIDRQNENVLYYGPGLHVMNGLTALKDNQTIYIDKDAVVMGGFRGENVKNIRLFGYGILDNSLLECGNQQFRCDSCDNIEIEGPTMLDASNWAVCFLVGKNISVKNIKLIGFWRYNADGVDFANVENGYIADSYIRSFDDCIVVKGLGDPEKSVNGILAENCVLWCDWGRALEIGAETRAVEMKNITFRNIDIIHSMDCMMDIQHGDKAEISDVCYENIRCEYTEKWMCPMIQSETQTVYENRNIWHMPAMFAFSVRSNPYSRDAETGSVRGIRIKDVSLISENYRNPDSWIEAFPDGSVIENVTFENLTYDGRKILCAEDMRLAINEKVIGLRFLP